VLGCHHGFGYRLSGSKIQIAFLGETKEHLNKQMAIVTRLVGSHRKGSSGRRFGGKCLLGTALAFMGSPLHKLGRRYAWCHRNRCRRAINRLANAQVTTRRWVFFASPR
jgi:hypothetical protein